jgi:hypothetical protein
MTCRSGLRTSAKLRDYGPERHRRAVRIDHCLLIRMLARVQWLRTVVTVSLLAFWLPATSHALLEESGLIHTHTDTDGASDTDNDHDAADGICLAASTDIQVPHPELSGALALAWTSLSFTLAGLFEASLALPNGPDPPGAAPPEFSQTWQFSFRASLPPRAPSLIS